MIRTLHDVKMGRFHQQCLDISPGDDIGNEQLVKLFCRIEGLEACLGCSARLEMQPLKAGSVPDAEADVSKLTGLQLIAREFGRSIRCGGVGRLV